jgi:adenine-specific DNA-methyltransferase
MTEHNTEINPFTPNFQAELASKLHGLVPEAISDGKVDVAKLAELLGGDASTDGERFGLFWSGKKRALLASQEPTTATLKPDQDESIHWASTKNAFIQGDNLEVLKILQKRYHNQIKMIYIDPPYNTGKDFVYPDNYKEGLKSYLEFTQQVDETGRKLGTNSELDGRFHSNWLNMMYPRLKLARNLLTDDGVIFVSIDDHEYDNLKKVLDEVFGEENFVNSFIWVSNLKGRQIKGVGAVGTKEFVLCYARRIDQLGEFRAIGSELKNLMPTVYKGFKYEVQEDEHGPYVLKNELYNTNSAFNEATRPNLVFDIYFNPETGAVKTAPVGESHLHSEFIKIAPKRNNNGVNKYHAFRWSTKKVESESHNLHFQEGPSGWKVYTKVRDVDSTSFKDLLMDISTNEGSSDISKLGLDSKLFDYPKPVSLIKLLCEVGTHKDSIVLDFFAGSGTTAQAVMELNAQDGGTRKFIQVQLPEPLPEDSEGAKAGYKTIADVSRIRIRTAAEKIEKSSPVVGDYGFRAYRLADTNFTKWRVTSDIEPNMLEQHLISLTDSSDDDATPDDLLTELLLKQGYSLNEELSTITVEGLELQSVGDQLLLAYLNEHVKPTLDQLRAVVEIDPAKFLILEDAFKGDDELKTNLVQLCKTKEIELWTA